jgi:SAM-dependent methyltransferase
MPITVLIGLPGAGKSSWLIEMVNAAIADGRPVQTFSCSESPWLDAREHVRIHRLLGCRRPGLVCPIHHYVSTEEGAKRLEETPPGTIAVFDEAYHFGKEIAPRWAEAAERGVEVFLATPSFAQQQALNTHPFTQKDFPMNCQKCLETEATTAVIVPGEDATLSLCDPCEETTRAEVRAALIQRLEEQPPYPGEKALYQPIDELEECADWRILRPDSQARVELMTRVIREVGVLDAVKDRAPTYLDVGCNTGYFCHHMRQLGFFAEGEDVVRGDIEVAQILDSWFRRDGNRYIVQDAYDYLRDTQDRMFDVTSAFAVFQWLMIQTTLERGVQCLEWLFAKTRRVCFLEMGYSAEEQYKDRLPGNIDRAWVFNVMEQKGGFSEIRMFDAKRNNLMFGSRDLFVGIKG